MERVLQFARHGATNRYGVVNLYVCVSTVASITTGVGGPCTSYALSVGAGMGGLVASRLLAIRYAASIS